MLTAFNVKFVNNAAKERDDKVQSSWKSERQTLFYNKTYEKEQYVKKAYH